jgi:AcrR family transcriptional regulator
MSERSLIQRPGAPKARRAAAARTRPEEERRTQILEAAARVFARRGFDAARVSEIARTAGLSEGSIYNYFRSKEDLLVHIPQHLVRPTLEALLAPEQPPETVADAQRQLTALAKGMVGRIRENAWFLKVFVSALPRLSPSAREQYVTVLPLYAAEKLEGLLRDGIRRGVFRGDLDAAVAARAFPGMLLIFLMMQEVLLEKKVVPHDYDTIAEETVSLFLYGAVPRASSPRPSAPS